MLRKTGSLQLGGLGFRSPVFSRWSAPCRGFFVGKEREPGNNAKSPNVTSGLLESFRRSNGCRTRTFNPCSLLLWRTRAPWHRRLLHWSGWPWHKALFTLRTLKCFPATRITSEGFVTPQRITDADCDSGCSKRSDFVENSVDCCGRYSSD